MLKDFGQLRAAHLRLGRRGENAAVRYLKRAGIEILTRNYRCPKGEIDIVARDGRELCFIEVKSRAAASTRRPADSLKPRQRRRIRAAAKRYVREAGLVRAPFRIDLMEIRLGRWVVAELRYRRNFISMPSGL